MCHTVLLICFATMCICFTTRKCNCTSYLLFLSYVAENKLQDKKLVRCLTLNLLQGLSLVFVVPVIFHLDRNWSYRIISFALDQISLF
jgi:hypothetical protein